jgi:predicted Zn-dependent protease
MMILNYSKADNWNIENRINRIFFVFCFLVITYCSGCSYQSPAPIYGGSRATNPYESNSTAGSESVNKTKNIAQSKSLRNVPLQGSASIENKSDLPAQKKRLSPAVIALVTEADKNSRAGDLESAAVTIERALRIDPRNPTLTYKLALIRLKQSKPRLAEDLAKKSALLAANDRDLKRQSWYLISEARRQQRNFHGAKEARIKADSI